MSLPPGSVIGGRYRVEAPLGRGGMGTVYRGWDLQDELRCAIKHLNLTGSDAEDQFATEARLLADLRSAHVPRAYAYLPSFELPGQALIMEYVEGVDLEQLLEQQGALDERTALQYARQILEALIHLHSQQPAIIHRDVKPANIRVDRHGNAWLLDLGIGKRVGPVTAPGARAATLAYAPPEQIQQAPTDGRSDLYALGATLYHLVVGMPPASAVERLSGLALVPPTTVNPTISRLFEQLILNALELDPNQRYHDSGSMHRDVEELLEPQLAAAYRAARKLHQEISLNMPQAIIDIRVLPPQQAVYDSVDPPLPPRLTAAYDNRRLYRHQAESVERARKGRDIVVVTGTASGKSMCYNLPVLERCLQDPRAAALYLFPIKALINDQAHQLEQVAHELDLPIGSIARLHGDLNQQERHAAQDNPPRIALSNPEFVHWMLARHPNWRLLFSRLQFIVLDEVHTYRGVFGSHVAQLMRRLQRICAHYGQTPQIICCSATVRNPSELVEKLTGRRPFVIDRDGAARVRRHLVFWQPIEIAQDTRRSASDDAWLITRRAVEQGQQVITFGRARQEVEQLLTHARRSAEEDGQRANIYTAYRSGYLRREREAIETGLRSRRLRGVFATNALELGIDIGGLEMSVLTGFPGSRMSFWQQAGRAGRRNADAHVVFVAGANALDKYFLSHQDDLLYGPSEDAVVDTANALIIAQHLCCMAREWPIAEAETYSWAPDVRAVFAQLIADGTLLAQAGRHGVPEYVYSRADLPHSRVSMRSASRESYAIVCAGQAEPLGTIEPPQLYREAHDGAIYYHQGEGYRVQQIDLAAREVRVVPERKDHLTQPLPTLAVSEEAKATLDLRASGVAAVLSFGRVQVSEEIAEFRELRRHPRQVVGTAKLALPYTYELDTTGFWIDLDANLQQELRALQPTASGQSHRALSHPPGNMLRAALHSVEHLLREMMPTVALCDRRDLGSYFAERLFPQDYARIYVYDLYPGGIGLAERGYRHIMTLLGRAYDVVAACPCTSGCPYCIHAGWCYQENRDLDKDAALYLLGRLLTRPTSRSTIPLTQRLGP